MNTIVEQTETTEISFGDKLRQTREALNLSLEDVAKAISLRPSILAKLENNEFVQKNVPSTFLRGYVRSYAKFLRIPDAEWTHLTFGEAHKNDLSKNTRATRSVNQYSSHSRWVGTLTTIILLAAVGMTGLWWWQNYQKSNEERDNLVQTYVEKEKTAEVPATHSNEIPVTVNSQPAVSSNETTSVVEKTNKILGDRAVVEPANLPDDDAVYLYNTIIMVTIFITIVSAINFAILYRYILSSRKQSLMVYRICGMSFARVVLLYLGECVVLTVPAYVIGVLLFEHVILKKVSKYYDYMSNSYSSYVYMVLFSIYFILSLLILLFMIIYALKTDKELDVKGGAR